MNYVTCQKPIVTAVDKRNRTLANTYCQRKVGHDGDCSPKRDKEPSK